MDEEADLIGQARKGAPEAFAHLVRMHQVHVRAYLARHVRSREAIDDLAQETFLGAYRMLGAFREESSLRLWLLGIARNQALIYLRKEKVRRAQKAEAFEAAFTEWAAQDLTSESFSPLGQELEALRNCIGSLPEASATLVNDHYFHRRGAAEIARRTGRKEGSIWMALLRVRQSLRRCVEGRLAVAEAGHE